MKRNKYMLVSKRGKKYSLDRQNWTMYHNFLQIVSASVAEQLLDLYGWIRMGVHVEKKTPLDV